jgi:hypothetical protein
MPATANPRWIDANASALPLQFALERSLDLSRNGPVHEVMARFRECPLAQWLNERFEARYRARRFLKSPNFRRAYEISERFVCTVSKLLDISRITDYLHKLLRHTISPCVNNYTGAERSSPALA